MARKIKHLSILLAIGLFLFPVFITLWLVIREDVIKDARSREDLIIRNISTANIEVIKTLLRKDIKVAKYLDDKDIILNDKISDKIFKSICKNNKSIESITIEQLGISSVLLKTDNTDKDKFLNILFPLKSHIGFIINMKIDLIALHDDIAELDFPAMAYVTVTHDSVYVYHPDENMIGKKVNTYNKLLREQVFSSRVKIVKNVFSEFLGIKVHKYFHVEHIGRNHCVYVAGLPSYRITELIDKTENAFILIAIIAIISLATLLIIGIISWRNEFRRREQVEQEKFNIELKTITQKENATATELEVLKKGLNPHFLFNSLSSLKILVKRHPDTATHFAESLSNIYRYMIKYESNNLTKIKDEIQFTKDYIRLKKIRFGGAIDYKITIEESLYEELIPPVSIQLLVENCIKHTIILESAPLFIEIFDKNDYIVVVNNYNPRISAEDSNGMGLSNLEKRYSFLTDKPCSFFVAKDRFFARIPFIKKNTL